MISIKIASDTFKPFLEQLEKRIENKKRLMESIGIYMVSSTQRKIKEGINPPLSEITKRFKRNNLPLQDTGRLLASFSYKATDDAVVVGTNVIYAPIQQKGGTIKPKKAKHLAIPAGWQTRKLMRRYGNTPARCIEGMKRAGYSVYVTKSKKAVMARKGKQKPFVLFILKREVKISAREFLKIDNTDRKIIKEKMEKWLEY